MTHSRRVRLLALSIALVLTMAALLSQNNIQKIVPPQVSLPGYYRVTYVYDGDTIAVAMNNSEEKIRLIGVDTPETHKPNTPVQCYGPQASEITTKTLNGQQVKLVADPLGDNRDRYGRLLRYVYLTDGTSWDEKLIRDGNGFAYLSFAFTQHDSFAAAQAEAQAAHRGLWAACHPTLQKGRWQSNALEQ